jgi:hypothetical protein
MGKPTFVGNEVAVIGWFAGGDVGFCAGTVGAS